MSFYLKIFRFVLGLTLLETLVQDKVTWTAFLGLHIAFGNFRFRWQWGQSDERIARGMPSTIRWDVSK